MGRMNTSLRLASAGVFCLGFLVPATAHANLSRNSSSAKNLGEAGATTVDTAMQLEKEPDEKTWVAEFGIQYELTRRLQFLAESVLLERVKTDAGETVSGIGDTDLTLSWLAIEESRAFPPLVLGAKIKLPIAGDAAIGTGEVDYSALAVLGKEFGELELNLELEFAKFGSPTGTKLENQMIYTFALDYGFTDLLSAYAEVFGNSKPSSGESRTDAALVGMEMEFPVTETAASYVSLEVDTEQVGTARVGVEWTW